MRWENGMEIIARIKSDFKEKFGIPRQSGLVEGSVAYVVFEPKYRVKEAFRGLEGYSHVWLLWEFSEAKRETWSPTVRPPRLGGNKRMGVFATRSPYRPNPIGLSSVRLAEIIEDEGLGIVLKVLGADLLDGTPIYDVKPYLPFTDSHPDAVGGFADERLRYRLEIKNTEALDSLPIEQRDALQSILEGDPRPSYQDDPDREYGMKYADLEVFFKVKDKILTITRIKK